MYFEGEEGVAQPHLTNGLGYSRQCPKRENDAVTSQPQPLKTIKSKKILLSTMFAFVLIFRLHDPESNL